MGDKRPYQAFGQWLKTARQDVHLIQKELATAMGFEVSIVQKVEQGQRRPSTAFIQRLAQVLQIPPEGIPAVDRLQATNVHIPRRGRLPGPGPLFSGSYLPLHPNPLFTGRDAELRQLARAFTRGTAVCVGQTVAATGLGGIGKTQLAVEFAHRYGRYFPGGVFWLNFAEPEAVANEVARCGRAEHLNLSPGYEQMPLAQQMALVRRAWQEPIPRLLIFDNCETEALFDQWRPTTGGCHILLTSRCQRWDPTLAVNHLIVGTLTRPASVTLLRQFVPEIAEEAATAIAATLDDLPLALHLAGSYLSLYGDSVPPDSYLAQLNGHGRLAHPSLQTGTRSPTRHEMHVANTFALSYDRLDTAVPVDRLAQQLLARAARFAPGEPIPPALLLATVEGEITGPQEASQALVRLEHLGLMTTGAGGVIRLHQLVAEFVQAVDRDEAAQTAVEATLMRLTSQCNEMRNLYPARNWQGQLRHVTAVAQSRADTTAAQLCQTFGWHLWICGDYQEAQMILETALKLCREVYGHLHPETAVTLNQLGRCCLPLTQLAAGRRYHEEALATQQQLYGEQHSLVAAAHNELALILQELAEYTAARSHLETAVHIRQQTLGPDHPDTGFSCLCLSLQLRLEGDYETARQWGTEALRIAETALGSDHPDTARALNALGLIYGDLGDLAKARSYFTCASHIRERVLGKEHNDTLSTKNNLNEILILDGHYHEALPALEQVLIVCERQYGPNHFRVAQTCRLLGTLFIELGDLDRAFAYLQRALSVYETTYGINNPALGNTLNYLGELHRRRGEWTQASDVLYRSLAIREEKKGAGHVDTAVTLAYLGHLLVDMGELETAQAHLERARTTLTHSLPENHLLLARNSQVSGCLMLARGEPEAARRYFAQALHVREQSLGPDHPHTRESQQSLNHLPA